MLDFRLETFLVLCRILNYTKTAEALHITQPAVSQHIKYLEDNYKVKLFEYKDKTLALTEAGKILYDSTISMKVSFDRTKLLMAAPKANTHPIHFGTTLTIGEYTMPNLLSKLISDFPDMNLIMEVNNTKILLEKLQDGMIDFVLLEGHFDKSLYESKLFSTEKFIGICSPKHPFSNSVLCFDDILSEKLILRENGSGTREIFEQILYEHNITMATFKNIIQLGNISAIKHMVKNNLGITFLYEEAVKDELKEGTLTKINISDFTVEREFNFAFLKGNLHYKEYIKFFDYLIKNRASLDFIT